MIACIHVAEPAQMAEILSQYGSPIEVSDVAYVAVGSGDAATKLAAQMSREMAAPVGLSTGKFPAYVASLFATPPEPGFIQPGMERDTLQSLPVTLLPLNAEIERQFWLLGIRTLGDFAALPAGAVVARFGKRGRELQRLAQGHDKRPLVPFMPKRCEETAFYLDQPITDRQILQTILDRLVVDLRQRLDGAAARELQLVASLESGERLEGTTTLREPATSQEYLCKCLRRLLNGLPITNGVVALHVTFKDVGPATGRQLDLFAQPHPLEEVLSDLVRRYGDVFYRISGAVEMESLPERRFQLEDI